MPKQYPHQYQSQSNQYLASALSSAFIKGGDNNIPIDSNIIVVVRHMHFSTVTSCDAIAQRQKKNAVWIKKNRGRAEAILPLTLFDKLGSLHNNYI